VNLAATTGANAHCFSAITGFDCPVVPVAKDIHQMPAEHLIAVCDKNVLFLNSEGATPAPDRVILFSAVHAAVIPSYIMGPFPHRSTACFGPLLSPLSSAVRKGRTGWLQRSKKGTGQYLRGANLRKFQDRMRAEMPSQMEQAAMAGQGSFDPSPEWSSFPTFVEG
jgi:hypothetical protein